MNQSGNITHKNNAIQVHNVPDSKHFMSENSTRNNLTDGRGIPVMPPTKNLKQSSKTFVPKMQNNQNPESGRYMKKQQMNTYPQQSPDFFLPGEIPQQTPQNKMNSKHPSRMKNTLNNSFQNYPNYQNQVNQYMDQNNNGMKYKVALITGVIVFLFTHTYGEALLSKYIPIFVIHPEEKHLPLPSLLVRAGMVATVVFILQNFIFP